MTGHFRCVCIYSLVPGSACVYAGVLRVDAQQVQGHVVEVVGGTEPVP